MEFDMSRTRGIDSDPVQQAMIAALGGFAKVTDSSIIAEGVGNWPRTRLPAQTACRLCPGLPSRPTRAIGTSIAVAFYRDV
ncbi:EAL domain-containing protein (putative c-di-GMP-specific phosphodiesterase class I) [Amorphus sp. MBR-141]